MYVIFTKQLFLINFSNILILWMDIKFNNQFHNVPYKISNVYYYKHLLSNDT